jgi:hypothetical protein
MELAEISSHRDLQWLQIMVGSELKMPFFLLCRLKVSSSPQTGHRQITSAIKRASKAILVLLSLPVIVTKKGFEAPPIWEIMAFCARLLRHAY